MLTRREFLNPFLIVKKKIVRGKKIMTIEEKVQILEERVISLFDKVNDLIGITNEEVCRVRHVPFKKLHPDAVPCDGARDSAPWGAAGRWAGARGSRAWSAPGHAAAATGAWR